MRACARAHTHTRTHAHTHTHTPADKHYNTNTLTGKQVEKDEVTKTFIKKPKETNKQLDRETNRDRKTK